MTFDSSSGTPKPFIEMKSQAPPSARYGQLLDAYLTSTRSLRSLEGRRASFDQIGVVDRERHRVHDELEKLGKALGKSRDDIGVDALTLEANLLEYGIKAPLLRLPIVGSYIHYGSHGEELTLDKATDGDRSTMRNLQALYSSDGKKIVETAPASISSAAIVEGDASAIEKWYRSPYFALIYTDVEHGRGGQFDRPTTLHDTRIQRRNALAHDFGLNRYKAYDLRGHLNYGEHSMEGVEISRDQILPVTDAMKTQPEKYWLTKEEREDPYRLEFLAKESSSSLRSYILVSKDRLQRKEFTPADWRACYDFLRAHTALQKTNSGYMFPFNIFWGDRNQPESAGKLTTAQKIEAAIEVAAGSNPKIAEEMKRMKESSLAYMQS